MKNGFQRRKPTVSNRAYRKAYGRLSPITMIIIVLLLAVIVTLSVIIAGYIKEDRQSANTTEPNNTQNDSTSQTVPEDTAPPFDYSGYSKITVSKGALSEGSLVLVNREHGYEISPSLSHINLYADKSRHYSVALADITLNEEAYNALGKMTNAFYSETGLEVLQITAGFRTKEQQTDFYKNMVSSVEDEGYYELAGYSDHHTGYAFDVKLYLDDGTSLSYGKNAEKHAKWVIDNHCKYGFVMRYPGDKTEHTGIIAEGNHFRYVGIPHSVYMGDNNLCLEEYISHLKSFTVQEPLKIVTGGKTYCVYYTQMIGETMEMYVPNTQYTLSGNNVDGFVVTYCAE